MSADRETVLHQELGRVDLMVVGDQGADDEARLDAVDEQIFQDVQVDAGVLPFDGVGQVPDGMGVDAGDQFVDLLVVDAQALGGGRLQLGQLLDDGDEIVALDLLDASRWPRTVMAIFRSFRYLLDIVFYLHFAGVCPGRCSPCARESKHFSRRFELLFLQLLVVVAAQVQRDVDDQGGVGDWASAGRRRRLSWRRLSGRSFFTSRMTTVMTFWALKKKLELLASSRISSQPVSSSPSK